MDLRATAQLGHVEMREICFPQLKRIGGNCVICKCDDEIIPTTCNIDDIIFFRDFCNKLLSCLMMLFSWVFVSYLIV